MAGCEWLIAGMDWGSIKRCECPGVPAYSWDILEMDLSIEFSRHAIEKM